MARGVLDARIDQPRTKPGTYTREQLGATLPIQLALDRTAAQIDWAESAVGRCIAMSDSTDPVDLDDRSILRDQHDLRALSCHIMMNVNAASENYGCRLFGLPLNSLDPFFSTCTPLRRARPHCGGFQDCSPRESSCLALLSPRTSRDDCLRVHVGCGITRTEFISRRETKCGQFPQQRAKTPLDDNDQAVISRRRRRDLNPRYPYGYSTLAGWCTRPNYATSPVFVSNHSHTPARARIGVSSCW